MKLGREDVEEIELVVDGTVDDESCTEVDGDVTELEEVRSGEAELEEIELVVDGRATTSLAQKSKRTSGSLKK